jgi:hypothetical protein
LSFTLYLALLGISLVSSLVLLLRLMGLTMNR